MHTNVVHSCESMHKHGEDRGYDQYLRLRDIMPDFETRCCYMGIKPISKRIHWAHLTANTGAEISKSRQSTDFISWSCPIDHKNSTQCRVNNKPTNFTWQTYFLACRLMKINYWASFWRCQQKELNILVNKNFGTSGYYTFSREE